MKDEVVIVDTNFDRVTRSGRIDDDISVEIMGRHGIAQSMVDALSCEAALSCTLQEPDDGKLCVPPIWLVVSVCYQCAGRGGPQPWQSQTQDVSGCWHDGACLPSAPPPGTSMCPCRGGRAWEGGEGRVQAERPTRTRPQGQGNGPEGERHTELDRSPCPGRRCPCGCPQQVDRLDHPLARGVARMAPGWLPTIMAGPAQPCPQRDETH